MKIRAASTLAQIMSEMAGTALLLFVGLSVVIALNGSGAPLWGVAPAALRRAVTGSLFGTVGLCICLSPVGVISGAHINPAVTFAFWLERRMTAQRALAYVMAQCAGAILGALPLTVWGAVGDSVDFGATVPVAGVSLWLCAAAEAVCTAMLVAIIFIFGAHRRLQALIPFTMPPLYGVMVWLEGPLTGTSTNPARSLGPAVLTGIWRGHWIYVLGPCLGALLVVRTLRLEIFRRHHPVEARVAHHHRLPRMLYHP